MGPILEVSNNANVWQMCSDVPLKVHCSGQIIATSNDLTPNGGLVSEIPLFQGKQFGQIYRREKKH